MEAGGSSKILSTYPLNCTVLQHERVEQSLQTQCPPLPTSSYNFIDWQEIGTELISLHNCITVVGYVSLFLHVFMTVVSGMRQHLHYLFMVYLIMP